MSPRALGLLSRTEELHRQYVEADSSASSLLDDVLYAEEFDASAALGQRREDYLRLHERSSAAAEKYFVVLCELLNELHETNPSPRRADSSRR